MKVVPIGKTWHIVVAGTNSPEDVSHVVALYGYDSTCTATRGDSAEWGAEQSVIVTLCTSESTEAMHKLADMLRVIYAQTAALLIDPSGNAFLITNLI